MRNMLGGEREGKMGGGEASGGRGRRGKEEGWGFGKEKRQGRERGDRGERSWRRRASSIRAQTGRPICGNGEMRKIFHLQREDVEKGVADEERWEVKGEVKGIKGRAQKEAQKTVRPARFSLRFLSPPSSEKASLGYV